MEIPETETVLPVPAFLSANAAVVYARVTVSPATLSLARVTVAVVVWSYVLLVPVAVTFRVRAVMFAVVVGAPV